MKKNYLGIAFVLALLLIGVGIYYRSTNKNNMTTNQMQNNGTDNGANGSTANQTDYKNPDGPDSGQSGWKVYKNDEFDFEFQYPEDWFLDGNRLSPQEIKDFEIGSDNAPIHFNVYTTNKQKTLSNKDILFFGDSIEKQISENYTRNKPDTELSINGILFTKYDLIDKGQYEGESAGNVIMIISPKLKDKDMFLVFTWEQYPGLARLENNNPEDFIKIVSTIKLAN